MFFLALFLLVHLIKACFFIQALCIAFAPFAALISAYIARRRNLPALRCALVGALSAVCFIMPWIYLIQRMRNKPISLGTANATYGSVSFCGVAENTEPRRGRRRKAYR